MEQDQRAFLKQPHIPVYKKTGVKGKKATTSRWYCDVGLGFTTPKTAIEGRYIDKKCPWTGEVSIRGRILKGVVRSTKMNRTIVVRRDYLHYISKFKRYEKRHSHISVHCTPALKVKEGDIVTFGECRPLSKTVHHNVLSVDAQEPHSKKKFVLF
ncbi:hypothetical protein P9112_008038 [Eukaryota sp. TZLM1-RC]